ncbi:MAG: alpha/beta family hydrolase [Actinomycetota bacterium]
MTADTFAGPRRGADRAVLLAHGAGSDRQAPALAAVADALAGVGVPSLRFDFPYRIAGRKAPDRPPVLAAAVEDAIRRLASRTGLPRERLVLGGRSMGGRYCSMAAADGGALGCALLGYPLHPPGKPDRLRVEHFGALTAPVLFAQGTRDSFGSPDELRAAAAAIPGRVTFHWVDSGDHGFRPLRSSGLDPDGVLVDVAAAVVAFVLGLPAP